MLDVLLALRFLFLCVYLCGPLLFPPHNTPPTHPPTPTIFSTYNFCTHFSYYNNFSHCHHLTNFQGFLGKLKSNSNSYMTVIIITNKNHFLALCFQNFQIYKQIQNITSPSAYQRSGPIDPKNTLSFNFRKHLLASRSRNICTQW